MFAWVGLAVVLLRGTVGNSVAIVLDVYSVSAAS